MSYDYEKYREKREKVLGVKKRGISFGTMAAMVSMAIIIGLGLVVVPKSIAFFNNRNLEDAIFKLGAETILTPDRLNTLLALNGVREAVSDSNGDRLVVTYDMSVIHQADLTTFFKSQGLDATLLNKVSHAQRLHTLKKEAAFAIPAEK